jgi:hypothetical protein
VTRTCRQGLIGDLKYDLANDVTFTVAEELSREIAAALAADVADRNASQAAVACASASDRLAPNTSTSTEKSGHSRGANEHTADMTSVACRSLQRRGPSLHS